MPQTRLLVDAVLVTVSSPGQLSKAVGVQYSILARQVSSPSGVEIWTFRGQSVMTGGYNDRNILFL